MWAWCIIVPCGCSLLSIPILAAVLFPVFATARERAREISCLSNVKQEGTAFLMYVQDYDERFPPAVSWMDTNMPYVKSEMVLHCPTVSKFSDASYGYAFSADLSRKELAKIKSPNTTVMEYDSSNLNRNATDAVTSLPSPPRHMKSNNRSYADGHAKRDAQPSSYP
jgi:prepilin-type processing-associated H-X9-DG protein